jgi:uncharacterized DUF497 family protein
MSSQKRGLSYRLNITTINKVRITFDRAKRDKTQKERGLDFRRSREVFGTAHLTRADDRHEYGGPRFITADRLDDRMVIIVWTPRGRARRVISMRKANEREIKALAPHLA